MSTTSGDHQDSPEAKKKSKWSAEEDAKIIQLRQDGMKWEDISRHLPGRSANSCRLRYQNYLEKKGDWDENQKDMLARLYVRFREDMWARVAEEMGTPWRAVEAMHWQIGEQEMAERAGVTPFSLNNANGGIDPTVLPRTPQRRRSGPPHHPPQEPPPFSTTLPSFADVFADFKQGLPRARYDYNRN
ncbi:Myb-like DNA-binding domain-containing protein [Cladophialophora immunda]|nr:Myb-like DNA-binding domain-containing protein [Cladophialophora immunda]